MVYVNLYKFMLMSDTEYITKNPRTISFKIKMLAHTFFTAPPAN